MPARPRGRCESGDRLGCGRAGHLICHQAKTWEAELILLGRRGRSGLKELMLGSVSSYVMHRANCSVLVIQGSLPATDEA
ncbi:MAG: universal stress protein [Synechococcales cyanobacterium RM1_1_8]|nr:universal stress protein [Synechococcales cyanobacterium RM1_1_8]